MARIRSIKPETPQSASLGAVSRDARLCFILLWTIADDHGRLRGAPVLLANTLFPYDKDAPDLIDGWLNELEAQGSIVRYQAKGQHFVAIPGWADHQRVDHPSKPKLPAPDAEGSVILARPNETFASVSRDESSLNGSTTSSESVGASREPREILAEEGNGLEGKGEERSRVSSEPKDFGPGYRGPKRYGDAHGMRIPAGPFLALPGGTWELPAKWVRDAKAAKNLTPADLDAFTSALSAKLRAAGGTVPVSDREVFGWLGDELTAWQGQRRSDAEGDRLARQTDALIAEQDRNFAAAANDRDEVRAIFRQGFRRG